MADLKEPTLLTSCPVKVLNDDLKIISYNGEAEGEESGIQNILEINDEPHCSGPGCNFDLVLAYKPDDSKATFTLTNVVLRGPEGCTAPLKDIAVFVTNEPPVVDKLCPLYNDVTEESFEDDEEAVANGYSCFVEADESTLEGQSPVKPWKQGKYIYVKLIRAHEPDFNLDVGYIAFVGFEGVAPSDTQGNEALYDTVPTSLKVSRRTLNRAGVNPLIEDFAFTLKELVVILCSGPEVDAKFNSCLDILSKIIADAEAARQVAVAELIEGGAEVDVTETYNATPVGLYTTPETDDEMRIGLLQLFGIQDTISCTNLAVLINGRKYLLEDPATDVAKISEWISACIDDTVPQFMKSAPRPEGDMSDQVQGLTVVTANSFGDLIADPAVDALFVAVDKDNEDDLSFLSCVYQVASMLDQTSVVVGEFDASENDLNPQWMPEMDPPIVRFFPKGDSKTDLGGYSVKGPSMKEMSAEALLQFIHKEMRGEKFSIEGLLPLAKTFDIRHKAIQNAQDTMEQFMHTAQQLGEAGQIPEFLEELTALQDAMSAFNETETEEAESAALVVIVDGTEALQKAGASALALHKLMGKADALVDRVSKALDAHQELITSEEANAAIIDGLQNVMQTLSEGPTAETLGASLSGLEQASSSFMEAVQAKIVAERSSRLGKVHYPQDRKSYDTLVNEAVQGNKIMVKCFVASYFLASVHVEQVIAAASMSFPEVTFILIDSAEPLGDEIFEENDVAAFPCFLFSKGDTLLSRASGAACRNLSAQLMAYGAQPCEDNCLRGCC